MRSDSSSTRGWRRGMTSVISLRPHCRRISSAIRAYTAASKSTRERIRVDRGKACSQSPGEKAPELWEGPPQYVRREQQRIPEKYSPLQSARHQEHAPRVEAGDSLRPGG